ncbi:hypothetical protein TNCV_914821 [Trichonephila clavipes]|uniref:Secreted protein n=1 Tax=Trichonephila clavipes TaxID=2585209 RepID=A0A8X6RI11_TRICX|nr:hypothetical protein TNCV_914821 [Trichonephila clavipes]
MALWIASFLLRLNCATCLTACLHLRWIDGAKTVEVLFCTARVTNEGRLESRVPPDPKTSILATMHKRSSSHGGYYWFI